MLMEETACTAGKPTQVSVSEHMGKWACLNVCVCRKRWCLPFLHMSQWDFACVCLCAPKWRMAPEESVAFAFYVCVWVLAGYRVCMCETINEWLKAQAGLSSKTAGSLHQLCCDNKISLHCAKGCCQAWCCDWNVWSPMAHTDGQIDEGTTDATCTSISSSQ